jgi:hypothetical protein
MRPDDPAQRLHAQLEHLRSDARLRERASLAGELAPEERLAETYALCQWAAFFVEQLPEDERQRALDYHEPVPPDAAVILRRLACLWSPPREVG